MEYKLYKHYQRYKRKFIAYFSNESEVIMFFNNPHELRHFFGLNFVNDFKIFNEVLFFVQEHRDLFYLEEQGDYSKWKKQYS